ncbi:NAD+ synthase (glutamine-hydrolysing) [Lachnospiraceae bacterium NE2001]|nr:NAD+ synthase (glutamine-hydrolysing) [Lachnospiraceae bacterium NE2001]
MFDFYRVAACVPAVMVANTEYNTDMILEKMSEAYDYKASIIAFPELSVSGYSCQDLFFQDTLLEGVKKGLGRIIDSTADREEVVIVGAPLKISNRLYNTAFVILNTRVLGISVKTYIPNHHEFYEKRWFSSADSLSISSITFSELGIELATEIEDYELPIGNNIIYDINGDIKFAIEICEDLWAPVSPSNALALGGAELIVNISASNETIAKREYRKNLVKQQSASLLCDYLYVSAGSGESTQDLIFSGHSILAENGAVINENKDFIASDYLLIADMDLGKIRHDRMTSTTFADSVDRYRDEISKLTTLYVSDVTLPSSDGEYVLASKKPFIPGTKVKRIKRCNEIFEMQVGGLARRLSLTFSKPVVGVSGGMDSTLTLLVCAQALAKLGRDPSELVAITMPAFGTSDRTYNNSLALIRALGTEPVIIDIKDSCIQHLKDIGHDIETKDVTYENTQARERTQVLMDYANKVGGLVVGTGDLSELALGWCTYNGDQMSMYGVNGSIPKTLVRWMIDSVVENDIFPEAEEVLKDILDTPISPELLPPDEEGNITQKTEDKVGPYELHDFFIFYSLRYGYSPSKIYFLAKKAFKDDYSDEEILKWMKMYYSRFFSQQFKRSCMPDGVKVGSVSMSPRGDLRMPSDAAALIWMDELESL